MEKKYIIYIIIVFIVFVVFMPVYLTPKPDMCVGQASRTEEVSLSYAEINKHENTIQDKIISGDTSTYITVSIYNMDSNIGDFLVVATFTPILNLDMSLLNKLTKDTINFDAKSKYKLHIFKKLLPEHFNINNEEMANINEVIWTKNGVISKIFRILS